MYSGNPILTLLLFGLPTAFLSIIIYASCFSDFLDAKEEDNEEEEELEGLLYVIYFELFMTTIMMNIFY